MSTDNGKDRANDPRLTAYALGELDGADREELERALEGDATARELVEEIRATGRLLEAELGRDGAERPAGLSAGQRAAVLASLSGAPVRAQRRRRTVPWVGLVAAAAAGVVAWFGVRWPEEPEAVAYVELMLPEGVGQPTGEASPDRAAVAATSAEDGNAPDSSLGFGFEGQGGPGGVYDWVEPSPAATDPGTGVFHLFSTAGEVDLPSVKANQLALGDPFGEPANGPSLFLSTTGDPPLDSAQWSGQHLYDLHGETIRPRPVVGLIAHDTRAGFTPLAVSPVTVPDDLRSLRSPGNESYTPIHENGFVPAAQNPLSTFSIDVDTASYANVRRFLRDGQAPPPDAVRIEELVNYFPYDYPAPEGERPFAVDVEVGAAPWAPEHRLVRIALQGRPPADAERRTSNLVFLLDVSGSMKPANKLPLLKDALRLMAAQLREGDTVAIVTYAGSSGLHLPATHGEDRAGILGAIDRLSAGGSTNGSGGLQLAYQIAREQYVEGGINRVLLATDGDFNVGITSDQELERLIAEEAGSGIFLTVLGFGDGNLKDSKLELLSGRGDGTYAYIDSLAEARKVLVDGLGGTLETIAKDVKLQVDFNPGRVQAYRLIGYENRALAARDFADDTKDAGEIGAGHSVTALYEVVPAGATLGGEVEPSKYVARPEPAPRPDPASISDELLTVRLRYKLPEEGESTRFDVPVVDAGLAFHELSDDTRFAAAVAAFGMLLRRSEHCGSATLEAVSSWALESLGEDPGGWRVEFCDLVGRARSLGR